MSADRHAMTKPIRSLLQVPRAVALALAAVACGDLVTSPGGGSPTVVALADAVVAGSGVPLRLHNPTEVTWTFATCPGGFQRLVGTTWTTVPPALVLCTANLLVISPGETIEGAAFLASEAPAGTYRAVVAFTSDGQAVTRVSNSFAVQGLPIGDALTVSVLQSSATRGSSITVRLLNPTTLDFLFNLCSSARLERLADGEWTATPEPLWACVAVLFPLDAGAFADEEYPILADVVPGTYRLRVPLHRADADAVTRYSNSFTVN